MHDELNNLLDEPGIEQTSEGIPFGNTENDGPKACTIAPGPETAYSSNYLIRRSLKKYSSTS